MKMHKINKIGLIACVALIAVVLQVRADMVLASSTLAEVAAAVTQANADLAAAANSGDMDKIKAAQAKVKAVAEAAKDALEAYVALENSGGENAEASAQLAAARAAAAKALGQNGAAIVATEGKETDALPNPKEVLWKSDGLRSIYEELYNTAQSASAQGGDDFVEQDATPQ